MRPTSNDCEYRMMNINMFLQIVVNSFIDFIPLLIKTIIILLTWMKIPMSKILKELQINTLVEKDRIS